MRSRETIDAIAEMNPNRHTALMLEVLLDIRQLLQKPKPVSKSIPVKQKVPPKKNPKNKEGGFLDVIKQAAMNTVSRE